jgi:Ti-type conjugative transfer relaxase TraA
MAIYHCSMKPIARSAGRSAIAAVAYRTASRLLNERDGLVHDFTAKRGVEHCEIVLPEGVEAEWARDRAVLWNAVERAENRKDARVAREFELALPHELTREQQIALTRAFAQHLADRYGAAVDFAIHRPTGETDIRNVHAHVLMTTRQIGEHGLGDKTLIERENKWLLNQNQPTAHMQLRDLRQAWESHANRALIKAGLDIRIDHRGHLERGLEIEPTEHVGVHASQMDRRGLGVSRARNDEKAAARNAALIRDKPEQVLALITGEKSVFDRHDVARTLHRYIDAPQQFRNAFATVMASPALVELRPEQDGELAKYSTTEMVEIEYAMASRASKMGGTRHHGVNVENVAAALSQQDDAIKAGVAASLQKELASGEMPHGLSRQRIDRAGLSDEQRLAVEHITGPEEIAAVIGFAGAGKSTMLAAAHDAWLRQGYRVHGAALAGKAAEGLEESSGIASRTLASWDYGWQRGRGELGQKDIFVIDEAGMVSSRQLAMFVAEVEARGAKLVLVGDHEQLQAIGAGSPFRAIVEQVGAVELSEIRRQKQNWQRDASIALATHRTAEGLSAYAERGDVRFASDREAARAELVTDYLADRAERPSGSCIALAHRRVDVRAINADIRTVLQERGQLAQGEEETAELGRERIYQTNNGTRAFAQADRIVLLENNRDLGLKNGMLGTVIAVEPDAIQIRLDGAGLNKARDVVLPVKSYQAFDHGYATTIHKLQGSTVDRAFVMASSTMDRHLTYVAMTRHRDGVQVYVGQDEMKDMKALTAGLSRSGAKETTLDYTKSFADRRGMADALGMSNDIGLGEAAIKVADSSVKKVPPLIPARTRYDRGVEEIAREKAMLDFERDFEAARLISHRVYAQPEKVAMALRPLIIEQHVDPEKLRRAVNEVPEQFGALRGKAGVFGENRERQAARHAARALGNHVEGAAQTWERRLEMERQSETWRREKQDVVEVPGLTGRSEEILRQLDAAPRVEREALLDAMADTAEGRLALEQARMIADALIRRFGSSDPREVARQMERAGQQIDGRVARGTHLARVRELAGWNAIAQRYESSISMGLGRE